MSRYSDLQTQYTTLIKSLHALIVSRQAAIATGQDVAAAQLAVQIQATGQLVNSITLELRQIEGPSSAFVMLDKVGDVVITGAKTGATAILDATGAIIKGASDAATGLGTAVKVLPWLVLALLAIIGYGVYNGSIKLKL
jgi:hypothetical protein